MFPAETWGKRYFVTSPTGPKGDKPGHTVRIYGAVDNTQLTFNPAIPDFYAEQSLPAGHGRNIVNVILVDFRALDTLGEITVFSIAAVGVYALLKLRMTTDPPSRPRPREARRAEREPEG